MNNAKPTYVVEADKLLSSHPRDLWAYRELFLLLVKRDFVAVYKQTVLGPLWFFVQPFLASLVFMIVFGQIARLPTTELPPLVFYMSGIIVWSFFSNCLTQVAATFLSILFVLNLLLGTFNLLPVPPLDGNTAITIFMSERTALRFLNWTRSQGFGMAGLLLAWVLYDKIFYTIFRASLAVLYPGSHWG